MSVIYQMNHPQEEVIAKLKRNEIPDCEHVYKPFDDTGAESLWPNGIKGHGAMGWFEGDLVVFWGGQNVAPLLRQLSKVGIITFYMG